MTNPPPGTNLTAKFEQLSTDVEGYIATTNTAVANLTASVNAGNAILNQILNRLATMNEKMQQAADCACSAATTLEEIAAGGGGTDPGNPCENATSDPATLNYLELLTEAVWVPQQQTSSWFLDMQDIAVSFGGTGGAATPEITLTGPYWLKLEILAPRFEDIDSFSIQVVFNGSVAYFLQAGGYNENQWYTTYLFIPAEGATLYLRAIEDGSASGPGHNTRWSQCYYNAGGS